LATHGGSLQRSRRRSDSERPVAVDTPWLRAA
jgi:hypothetical protein